MHMRSSEHVRIMSVGPSPRNKALRPVTKDQPTEVLFGTGIRRTSRCQQFFWRGHPWRKGQTSTTFKEFPKEVFSEKLWAEASIPDEAKRRTFWKNSAIPFSVLVAAGHPFPTKSPESEKPFIRSFLAFIINYANLKWRFGLQIFPGEVALSAWNRCGSWDLGASPSRSVGWNYRMHRLFGEGRKTWACKAFLHQIFLGRLCNSHLVFVCLPTKWLPSPHHVFAGAEILCILLCMEPAAHDQLHRGHVVSESSSTTRLLHIIGSGLECLQTVQVISIWLLSKCKEILL